MATTKTYALPNPAAVAAKVAAAGGPQIDLTHSTGSAHAEGITIGWSIAGGSVTVSILGKPWFVSDNMIWSHVDALFA